MTPGPGFLAFPNAYIDTDEPPRKSTTRTVLSLLAIIGVGYLGAVILALSLFWGGYSPITQVASDYGVGTFGPLMNSGFFLAGVGVLGLGSVLTFSRRRKGQRVGGALLFPAGLALVVNAFFQTDVEGAARTLHGTIHGFGGAFFFFTAPLGLILISHGYGRRAGYLTLLGVAVAVMVFPVTGAMDLNASGLAERVAIGVVFPLLMVTALRTYREG